MIRPSHLIARLRRRLFGQRVSAQLAEKVEPTPLDALRAALQKQLAADLKRDRRG